MMKKISHSVLFVLLSAIGGMALAANYYPPSDIVETTDPAAAQAVLKQAREIQMQESTSSQPVKQKANKTRKKENGQKNQNGNGRNFHAIVVN